MAGSRESKPLIVLTSHVAAEYHRVIYDCLAGRVTDSGLNRPGRWEPRSFDDMLAGADVFHLHWPEWLLPPDIRLHQQFIAALRRSGLTLILSQHNLRPHRSSDALDHIYQLWAGAADGVIHHSQWGMERALAFQPYRPGCRHVVIGHPHFGPLVTQRDARPEVERQFGWRSDVTRLSIIGAPRPAKEVDEVMAAFARTRRPDLELRVFCLDGGGPVPEDPRIFVEPYSRVGRSTYDRRLIASDALIMPFHRTEMLTTGTVADAIAHGLPCLTSDWRFLDEVLGDAAISYGAQPAGLSTCLEQLDRAQLRRAADAAAALRVRYDPAQTAEAVFAFVEEVRASTLSSPIRLSPSRWAHIVKQVQDEVAMQREGLVTDTPKAPEKEPTATRTRN